jgi:recombination protein RecT
VQNAPAARQVPRPAATVMLVRPAAAGFTVYMARRSTKSRFMPAVHVFPGGAVDIEDRSASALERMQGPVASPGALAVAALRELFEEAGILLACDERGRAAAPSSATLARMRAERSEGADFSAILARHGLRLDARELVYYSNWVTPQSEPIRFDAHFFLARAPLGQVAEADAVELHDGVWIAPADALARAARGDFPIIFPTRSHLERLAGFDDVDALLKHARTRTIRAVMPIEDANGAIAFAGDDELAW